MSSLPLLVLEEIFTYHPQRITSVCKLWRTILVNMMIHRQNYIYALVYHKIPQVLRRPINLEFLVTVVMYGADDDRMQVYDHLFGTNEEIYLATVCKHWHHYLKLMSLEDFVIEQCTYARADLLRRLHENGHIIPAHVIMKKYLNPQVAAYIHELRERREMFVDDTLCTRVWTLRSLGA